MNLNLKFPSTFQIALLLSLIVYLLAVAITLPIDANLLGYSFEVLGFWKTGFWELLEFTMQMILILVLGHTLAMSKPVNYLLDKVASTATNNSQAVLMTGMGAITGGYINWGFGLIFGAVLARKIGEYASRNNIEINYPLVAASGYLGMLVWHGGFSGSSTLKVAEDNHFLADTIGTITVDQTIFSSFNLWVNLSLIICLGISLYILSKRRFIKFDIAFEDKMFERKKIVGKGVDKLGYILGVLILVLVLVDFLKVGDEGWGFLDLNFVNFALLGFGLLAFGSLNEYVISLRDAVKGATDILIQFPFYAGILGIMKYSGLLVLLADDMVSRSGADTFPLLSFFSAALINFFVPSGGGQWAIQGPVVMEAAEKMGIEIPKMILVFAYGDQVSNMLQPFWALPLLSITGLSAKEILKYTSIFFLTAFIVFGLFVWYGVS
ncbi:MAG: short-chain fatty acid transporter [Mongoliibacter sp.]|nr:MAG: short-chain fatty acid transporter [Mongoliibacter sp.]